MRFEKLSGDGCLNGGRVMEAILFVDKGEESQRAQEALANAGIKLRIIDVSKNGLRGWLLFEYGTSKVPLLVYDGKILAGLEEILKALR